MMVTCEINAATYNGDNAWTVESVYSDKDGDRRGAQIVSAPETATEKRLAGLVCASYGTKLGQKD